MEPIEIPEAQKKNLLAVAAGRELMQ